MVLHLSTMDPSIYLLYLAQTLQEWEGNFRAILFLDYNFPQTSFYNNKPVYIRTPVRTALGNRQCSFARFSGPLFVWVR